MKIYRYEDSKGVVRWGVGRGGDIVEATGEPFTGLQPTNTVADVKALLAPIAPRAIVGIGLNYRKHAEEGGAAIPTYPVVFMKLPGSIQHPGGPIVLPRHLRSDAVDYECELAVVIGRRCKNVSVDDALDYVLGYTCANDVSARDWQIDRGGSQWSRGKMFDTFAPMGPCIVTTDDIPDPHVLGIRTILNGEVVQDWTTGDMIFSVPEIISFLSGSTTLEPGTVILTGTPHGVGMAKDPPVWLAEGDRVTVEIDSIGQLENTILEEAD